MTLPDTLRTLTPAEKLAIVTELWDSLAASAPIVLPPDELEEMQRRQAEMNADPSIAIDREELWRRVNGK